MNGPKYDLTMLTIPAYQ